MKENRSVLKAELKQVSLNRFVLSVWEETITCEKDAFPTKGSAITFARNRYGLGPDDVEFKKLED